jgi:hypothetical protein
MKKLTVEMVNPEDILFDYLSLEKNEGVPFTEEQKNEIRQDRMHTIILAVATSYGKKLLLNSIQDEPDGWVDVKDRLPDDNRKVNVYFKHVDNILIGRYYNVEVCWKVFYSDGEKFNGKYCELITHWRELPQPPKNK